MPNAKKNKTAEQKNVTSLEIGRNTPSSPFPVAGYLIKEHSGAELRCRPGDRTASAAYKREEVMRTLRVAGMLGLAIATLAATPSAQSSASYAAASSTRTDSSRAASATRASDSLGTVDARGTRGTSAIVMRDANSFVSQRTDDTTRYENLLGTIGVQSVRDGAGYVVLEDGTVWKVALSDRPRVDQWKAGDQVILRTAPIVEGKDFRYRLVNGRDESDVLVAFRGSDQPAD